ncbi:glycosyltransferase family 2 protein [Empedobacter falsenii]
MIKDQRKNPLLIPIIIINFNQLYYLKQLVSFLCNRGFQNIIILDNQSTYKPLLDYYKEIENSVTIEKMDYNGGHDIFFTNKELQRKYAKGYYVLTDPDIVPNENLPENFMKDLIEKLDFYFKRVTKVGFALKIDDVPDYFPFKEKVLKWEAKYWNHQVENDCFLNYIDTTFALYKPMYPMFFTNIDFYSGIRMGGNYIAKHGGWYKNPHNLSEEEVFYQKNANSSSSWNFDENKNSMGIISY